MENNKRKGFTLLEIVVVMIIVGVLAAIALPQLFSQVQRSRGQEAMVMISAMKNAIESCMMRSNTAYYYECATLSVATGTTTTPFNTTNFTYTMQQDSTSYIIIATRNTLNGGDNSSSLRLTRTDAGVITKDGTGIWSGGW